MTICRRDEVKIDDQPHMLVRQHKQQNYAHTTEFLGRMLCDADMKILRARELYPNNKNIFRNSSDLQIDRHVHIWIRAFPRNQVNLKYNRFFFLPARLRHTVNIFEKDFN